MIFSFSDFSSSTLVAGNISLLNPFFITLKFQKHNLPFTYNFHMYMVRTMEDEFHGIVGIRYAFLRIEILSKTLYSTVFRRFRKGIAEWD